MRWLLEGFGVLLAFALVIFWLGAIGAWMDRLEDDRRRKREEED